MSKLPDYHELPKYPRTPLKSLFTAATPDALDLLNKMLDYDPLKRPTSLEVLQHNYFAALPRPSHPSRLPKPAKQDEDKGIKRKFNDSLESSDRKVARKLF
jgi:cyclin-dependent kinase 7